MAQQPVFVPGFPSSLRVREAIAAVAFRGGDGRLYVRPDLDIRIVTMTLFDATKPSLGADGQLSNIPGLAALRASLWVLAAESGAGRLAGRPEVGPRASARPAEIHSRWSILLDSIRRVADVLWALEALWLGQARAELAALPAARA